MSSTEPEHRPSTAALVPQVVAGGHTLVRPIAAEAEIVEAFNAYQHLCSTLLSADDYQSFSGGKSFRKKSAWRKLAVAMGVSCEIIDRSYERDGGRIIRAEIVVRATAPNGRSWDGLGACDLFEKCCVQPCSKRSWNNHTCCDANCSGARHFSNPQHDLPATAATRATNRACADLFGFGEVSAEEIVDRGDGAGTEHRAGGNVYEELGWRSKRDHDAARTALVDVLRALPEESQRRFRLWREASEIDINKPLGAEQMESAAKLAKLLTDGKVQIDDEGTVSLVDEPEQPPTGDQPPQAPESDPAPDAAPAPPDAGDGESGTDPAESEAPPVAPDGLPANPEFHDGNDDDDHEACPACLGGPNKRIDPDCWGCDGAGTVAPAKLSTVAGVIEQQTKEPAAPACTICGSTRSSLVSVAGVDRCSDGSGCKRRAAERQAAAQAQLDAAAK